VVDEIFALRSTLTAEGFVVSDRRWKKLLTALRAVAWCGGRDTVSIRDFDVVQHSLWRQPADRPKIASMVAKTMAPNLAEAVEVHDGILELVRGLPQTGELGPNGRTVISELKKAIKRTTELSADSQNGIGEMITEMVDRLRGEHEALTKRIMQELGL
jgi:MoxR-like ATPase